MIFAYLENDNIAKLCPHLYFIFHLELKKEGLTLAEFALELDKAEYKLNKTKPVLINAYHKLRKKVSRKLKMEVNLSMQPAWEPKKSMSYYSVPSPPRYTDINNQKVDPYQLTNPVWVTVVKLAPIFKKNEVKVVIKG